MPVLVSGWLTRLCRLAGWIRESFGRYPKRVSTEDLHLKCECLSFARCSGVRIDATSRRRSSASLNPWRPAMFSTLMITFREGVEALLIVAIALMYLRRTGREFLVPAIHAGWATAITGSVLLGVLLAKVGAMTPLAEGVLALVAAVLVISCTQHMLRMGRKMKGAIDSKLEAASMKPSAGAYTAVFLFILLMVGREGVETATMIPRSPRRATSGISR